ncbi:MAG: acyl-CoA dehydrogenase family protein, partial [Betaproteobacteria bacterium]
MGLLIWFVIVLIGAIVLAYLAVPGWAWATAAGVALLVAGATRVLPALLLLPLGLLFILIVPSLLIPQLRRWLYTAPVLSFYRKIMPPMSETERDALEAGTVWWDGELFSGNPDWGRMLTTRAPHLSAEEQSFLDNETEQLCAMIDEWKIISELHDLPPDVWRFIKDRGFLGLIIPKEYGGKQFCAYAHSQIITKLS